VTGYLGLYSISEGKVIFQFKGHSKPVICIRVKGELMVSSAEGDIRLWNLRTRHCISQFNVNGAVWSLDISCNLLIAGCTMDGGRCSAKIWDIVTKDFLADIPFQHQSSRVKCLQMIGTQLWCSTNYLYVFDFKNSQWWWEQVVYCPKLQIWMKWVHSFACIEMWLKVLLNNTEKIVLWRVSEHYLFISHDRV
jgi:WD40 repeat protein